MASKINSGVVQQQPQMKEVPAVIFHSAKRKRYLRGPFLGKGGFARCYELTDVMTNETFAGKIVSKTLLLKKHQRDKMAQEIQIHKSLKHKHVVGFHSYFEDSDNVYVLLELCRKRSLMELQKRRKSLSEPEARYFFHQLVVACQYLHGQRVIHRDLKLGNIFLSDDMEIRIGDFGLATKLDFDGERKKTMCGTPNYIAPEVLGKQGHSFEVDVWALGCILYTLLVGRPPFETLTLKQTYDRIARNDYDIPARISHHAKVLIQRLLLSDPTKRPTVFEILHFDFFTQGYLPLRLPASCLTMAPQFASPRSTAAKFRKPLVDATNKDELQQAGVQMRKEELATAAIWPLKPVPEQQSAPMEVNDEQEELPYGEDDVPADFYLAELYGQLSRLLASKPSKRAVISEDDAEDPAAIPVFWIGKWIDYSETYGFGYQLSDNSAGVLFNDNTRVVLSSDGEQIQYVENDGTEHFYRLGDRDHPEALSKRIQLLKYFHLFMNERLAQTGEDVKRREGDQFARLPYLRDWLRTESAIIMHLTNGTLQVNFFECHTKIILCPLMNAVTYIDENRKFRTFRFSLLEKFGCSPEFESRLRCAREMIKRLFNGSRQSYANTSAYAAETGPSRI